MNDMYDQNDFWKRLDDGLRFQPAVIGDFVRLRLIEEVGNVIVRWPDGRVRLVDVGCGTGRVTRELATLSDQMEIVAFDRDEDMLQKAKVREQANPMGICYQIGSASVEQSWEGLWDLDLIFSSAALMHIPLPELRAFLRIAHARLRPRGKILLSVLPHPELLEVAGDGLCAFVNYKVIDDGGDVPSISSIESVGERQDECSVKIHESYRNALSGQVYESQVWAHTPEMVMSLLQKLGFTSISDLSLEITADMLTTCGFSGNDVSVGKKSHFIVTATK